MSIFIKFIDDTSRVAFFNKIKENSNLTWKDLRKTHQISKGCLDNYKSGLSAIPEIIFHKLLSYLPEEFKFNTLQTTISIDSTDWLKKGGRNAYRINFKKFEEGRLKGIKSIKIISKKPKIFSFSTFKLSPEICEFVGTFIGDGFFNCYNNKLYHIEFSGDKRFDTDYYYETIIPIIKREIPELKPQISFPKNKNTLKVRFFSKKLFCFLKQEFGFKPGVKTYTVTIPERIMNAGEEYIDRAIRGIFDTDGTFFLDERKSYKRPYPRISLQTASEPLYNQLREYLSKYFSLNSGKNKNRNIYYIEIYGFDSLKKWMSKIGFSNKRHLNKIATVA